MKVFGLAILTLLSMQEALDNISVEDSQVGMVGNFLKSTSNIYVQQVKRAHSSLHYLKFASARSNQLLETIYIIYRKIEKVNMIRPHVLLVCGVDTTENQLEAMFKRAKCFIDVYMLVGINNLRYELQEVSIKIPAHRCI